MKLQLQISIDIDAPDYVAAAEHQRRAQGVLDQVRAEYAQARLSFGQAKGRAAPSDTQRPVRRRTGNLALYAEV